MTEIDEHEVKCFERRHLMDAVNISQNQLDRLVRVGLISPQPAPQHGLSRLFSKRDAGRAMLATLMYSAGLTTQDVQHAFELIRNYGTVQAIVEGLHVEIDLTTRNIRLTPPRNDYPPCFVTFSLAYIGETVENGLALGVAA